MFVNYEHPIDILLVEDNKAHAELIRRGLDDAEKTYHVRILRDIESAKQAMAEQPPHLALIDMQLPDGLGISLLTQCRDYGKFPIVIMTSHGNEDAAVNAMKMGAIDYVVKTQTSLLKMAHVIERTLREWDHIVQRREAEIALRANEAKYRRLSNEFQTLLEGIPDVLALVDRNLQLVWSNSAARDAALPGVDWSTGRYCYELWHNRDEICRDCPALRTFQSGETEEQIIERAADKTLWGVKVFPLKNAEGCIYNVIILATDITEKVQLRAEVVRSGQLASLGELAAGLAHEINNPINGIINFGQILADQSTERTNQQYARNIINEGQRVAMIVRNLLSFACEPFPSRRGPVDLPEAAASVLVLTEAQLRRDGIKVDLKVEPELPEVAGQRQQLQQVLLNLISNARYALNQKFDSDHADKRIEISMQQLKIGNEYRVRLMVTDFGTGIPPRFLPRILDPFFTTKPHDKGTGLGMSISHGIIRELGGRIFISSIEQRHTTITIDLPIYQEVSESHVE